jgi:8-oxo-dGTP pyrophosphatase MutT (NUDIX family)
MTEKSVKGIIVRGGKFLVIKQSVDGRMYYSLPGGRVEGGNEKRELKREVKEETGLAVEVGEYVGEWQFTRNDGTVTKLNTYLCRPVSGKIHHENSEEYEDIQEFLWVTKEEFLEGGYSDNESLKNVISQANFG